MSEMEMDSKVRIDLVSLAGHIRHGAMLIEISLRNQRDEAARLVAQDVVFCAEKIIEVMKETGK